jgi:hypothetical protein
MPQQPQQQGGGGGGGGAGVATSDVMLKAQQAQYGSGTAQQAQYGSTLPPGMGGYGMGYPPVCFICSA